MTRAVNTALAGAGGILQVVSVAKTDVFSTTATSFTDVTGLTVTITPKSASNYILVLGSVELGAGPDVGFIRLMRDSTPIQIGDAAGVRVQCTAQMRNSTDVADADSCAIAYKDSPATTSPVTYKIQTYAAGGVTVRINASADDLNQTNRGRTASTLILMEIAG
jgi:hypothetical protein